MPLAARVTDFHSCPASSGPDPHVGGPILPPCSPNVQTNSLPQARATDRAMCAGPVDFIVVGSSSVTVNDLPAARMGDPTMHGGAIAIGSSNVEIGGPPVGVTLGNPAAGEHACQLAANSRFIQIAEYPGWPDMWKFQSWGNCGPESLRQIVNTVHRSNISEDDFLNEALESGKANFSREQGKLGGISFRTNEYNPLASTPPDDAFWRYTDLLEEHGVPAKQVPGTAENLKQAVAERRGVVVTLMAGTLWHETGENATPLGKAPHVVIATGVKFDPAGKIQEVIINDSGAGHCSEPIGFVRFMNAITDLYGGGPYVVTDSPIW
jgi:uncharacterized Zn-binding protein involved in type VI secretion